MSKKKTEQEIADELGKLFQNYVDSLEIDEFYGHFCAELGVAKNARAHNAPYALSDEKIAALEKAVEEFKMVYEAEKAEAAKMPLSWHEARRVLKLFDEAEDKFNPPPAPPVEH
jgi:hypothetical protein